MTVQLKLLRTVDTVILFEENINQRQVGRSNYKTNLKERFGVFSLFWLKPSVKESRYFCHKWALRETNEIILFYWRASN